MELKSLIKSTTHPSWHSLLINAANKLDKEYIEFIENGNYLPTNNRLFNAFRDIPKSSVKYILFGQDPYPREQSAIGVAFIDGSVENIFTDSGLSKEVNRATSLRNFIKMALVASNRLKGNNTTKDALKNLKKDDLIDSIYQLKSNFEKSGVLLLNASLIYTEKKSSSYHAKKWQPFIKELLDNLSSDIELILFGNFAKDIKKKLNPKQKTIELEHPYNISFITNKKALKLFGDMNLLFPHYCMI